MDKLKTSSPDSNVYFENLDGLRFLCFLMVFLFHSFHTENQEILTNPAYHTIKETIFGNGNIGVNVFFVLSGFLISYLLIQEKVKSETVHVLKFWMRRVLRIWPLYFACVFFGFVIFPLLKSSAHETYTESANLLSYLTFTSNFDIIYNGLPNASSLGVLWSIAIEEQFYLFWPLLFLVFPLKRIWIPIVGIIALSIAFRCFYNSYPIREHHTLSCMNDLAMGALGAWLVQFKPGFKQAFIDLSKKWIIGIYIVFIALFLFREQIFNSNFILFVTDKFYLSIFILFIILEQCYSTHSIFKFSNFKLLSKLGRYTYGMYCLQFIGILITLKLTGFLHWNTTIWHVMLLETVLALAVTIALSLLSYYLLERYFLKLKKRFN